MSLRIPLVLLSLLTLLLPWAGCEYAQQMETVLRKGQEDSLLTTARILGTVVGSDSLLIEQSFPPQSSTQNTLFAAQLLTNPLLDGFPDEWPLPTRALPSEYESSSPSSAVVTTDSTTPRLRLGIYGSAIFAFLHVPDANVVYEVPRDEEQPETAIDRVLLLSRDLTGIERAWSISAVAPGPVIVRSAATQAPWRAQTKQDDDIYGRWRATNDGFDIELRIPQRLLGASIAVVALDDKLIEQPEVKLQALHTASEALREKLQSYAAPGVRISVVDSQGWLLARAGALIQTSDTSDDTPNLYRWLLSREGQSAPAYGLPYGMWGPPVDAARKGVSSAMWFDAGAGEPTTVRAAVPMVATGANNTTMPIGVVAVEQAADQLDRERYSALLNLLQFSFLATFLAVLATLGFAAWLSRRIRRLSVAATNALSPEGRIEQRLPETGARDELGDLARNFASLLHRINEYATYLQTLGSKLSHEFRTPLAIVSSSLDNLAADPVATEANRKQFIDRARDGTLRLQSILSAMTEATRVEQSIEQADQVEFDLRELVRSAAIAYQQTFSTHRIEARVPDDACTMRGAPDLIAQLLDKLVDNAVDFCPHQGQIIIELWAEPKLYRLTVSNEGPLLPPDKETKIFDMLVSNRTTGGAKPHLGLGLYIVQLIARFHRGDVSARNLVDATGVAFDVRLMR